MFCVLNGVRRMEAAQNHLVSQGLASGVGQRSAPPSTTATVPESLGS